ncbi:HAD family hydrolase [Microbacterium sp. TPD7012]|uniref:HAD family hydrolase n=1 Tax=Microbacterium sp. TPD7012 TaxID=2171975 RepID=UPI0014029D0C|nr:HAD family hydrolase [Microbacterium sp. TPD7012]
MSLALFDLDGTLVDQESAAKRWVKDLVRASSLPDALVTPIATALSQRRPKGEVFADIVEEFSLPWDPEALWEQYRVQTPGLVQCAAADLDALRRLRDAGWTLGIITNGETDNQEGKIRSTGLSDLVDGWAISAEAGYRKPDPALFRLIADRLGKPLDGWMVGDGLDADIVGGAAVGLQTILIAKDSSESRDAMAGRVPPTAIVPDVATAAGLILDASHD